RRVRHQEHINPMGRGRRLLFDYGCGFGSDIEGLQAAGISAAGWDPYYAPDQPCEPAHVVNLGFVLNVIETAAERQDDAEHPAQFRPVRT
ncbi:hypothetical protein, partial [Roseinatronobacter sp.]|uniref:hypothetical protein n=1 Tax=Roseinatronobacter sp. TaxID=1945755 RepID=UPI0025D1008A